MTNFYINFFHGIKKFLNLSLFFKKIVILKYFCIFSYITLALHIYQSKIVSNASECLCECISE